jgi:hypothetical protein
MIADAPLSAGSQFTDVVNAARAYIVTAKVAAKDGLNWSEFGELLMGLLRLTIHAADVLNVPGQQKKAVVMEAAAVLFDALADRAVPVWVYPFWIAVRGPTRALVLAIASGAIEQLLPLVRSAP